jgi:hydrogenase maturation factor HypF (carbamoyltransferase family)
MEIMDNHSKSDIALEVHGTLGKTLGDVACSVCDEYGLKSIGLGGGSAINSILSQKIKESIEHKNKNFLTFKSIPCGDGGTSCGQAISASARI